MKPNARGTVRNECLLRLRVYRVVVNDTGSMKFRLFATARGTAPRPGHCSRIRRDALKARITERAKKINGQTVLGEEQASLLPAIPGIDGVAASSIVLRPRRRGRRADFRAQCPARRICMPRRYGRIASANAWTEPLPTAPGKSTGHPAPPNPAISSNAAQLRRCSAVARPEPGRVSRQTDLRFPEPDSGGPECDSDPTSTVGAAFS